MDGLNALIATGGGYRPPQLDLEMPQRMAGNALLQQNMGMRNQLLQQEVEQQPYKQQLDEKARKLQEIALDIYAKTVAQEKEDNVSIDIPSGTLSGRKGAMLRFLRNTVKFPDQAFQGEEFAPEYLAYMAEEGVSFKQKETKSAEGYKPKTMEESIEFETKKAAGKAKVESQYEGLKMGPQFEDDKGNVMQPFFDKQGNLVKAQNLGRAKPKTKEEQGKDPKQLRGEFTKQSATFVDVRDSYNRIVAGAKDPSAAGDVALIFNFMKMLDPQSTVRESEYATAANAAGVPDRIRATWNKLLNGERLAPDQRVDFVGRAKMIYSEQLNSHKKLVSEYSRLATQAGVTPSDVIVDYQTRSEEPYDVGSIYEDANGIRKKYLGDGKWGKL